MALTDAKSLISRRCSVTEMVPLTGQGVYVYCLDWEGELPGISIPNNGILYVGMTEDGLDVRNHVSHAHSGFSTLRRSLGAILKADLKLTALPRSSGSSRSNLRCYRFTEAGEAALTEWMERNLLCAQQEIEGDVCAYERELIATLQPPLNLKGWRNPQAAHIKALRSACVREAELIGVRPLSY